MPDEIKPQKLPAGTFAVTYKPNQRRHGPTNPRYPEMNVTRTAPLIGISKAHFQQVLNGKVPPSLAVAKRISRVLGVSIEEIGDWISAETKSDRERRQRERKRDRQRERKLENQKRNSKFEKRRQRSEQSEQIAAAADANQTPAK